MRAVALDLDAVLGDTRPLWNEWLEDAARRFKAIAPLDSAALPADRGEAARELDRWAETGVGDWRVLLERFAEDHAGSRFRPRPQANADLRRLKAAGIRLGAFTDAPEPLARVALAHLGAARHLDALETGAGARARLLERLGPGAIVVGSSDELSQA